MFTWLLSCCRCDQFLLWYEVAVKICQRASAGTALSCPWARGVFSSKHVRFFFFFFRYRCLEISFRLQDVFGMLWCVGISLLMSSSWLNTLTNQQSYFPDERLQCHKQKNQSNCRSFFLLFVVISQMNFFFFFFWNAVVEECSTTKNSAACFHYKLDPLTVRANWRHVCIILIFLSER